MGGRRAHQPGEFIWTTPYVGPGATGNGEDEIYINSDVPNESARPRRSKSTGKANQRPCGCCQDARVKCVMDSPHSVNRCERCTKRGVACLPHMTRRKPNGTRREGTPISSVADSESDTDRDHNRPIRNNIPNQFTELGDVASFVHDRATAQLPIAPPSVQNYPAGPTPIVTPYNWASNTTTVTSSLYSNQTPSWHSSMNMNTSPLYDPQVSSNPFIPPGGDDILIAYLSAQLLDQHFGAGQPSTDNGPAYGPLTFPNNFRQF